MRLAGLRVDSYGILSDLMLDENDLDGMPVIVYGKNEAGKSTLLSFIRGVLFGFKAEGAKSEPVRGGPAGGWLRLEEEGEVFRVQRTGKGDGKVIVEVPDGTKEGEIFLRRRILRGVSPTLFKNVFAIGIDELRKIDDLKKEEVSSYIYGAGTGVKPEKLAQATSALNSSALNLFNPDKRAQKPEINKILVELNKLDRQIKQLEQQPEQYGQWKTRQEELAEEQKRLVEESRSHTQHRVSRLENLRRAREPWIKLQSYRMQLAEQKQITSFPADGMTRLEKLEERKTGKLEIIRSYALTIENLQEKLRSHPVDSAILAQSVVIRNLDSERALYAEKLQKLTEEEARVKHLEEQVQEQLANLGPAWNEEKVLALDLSLAVRRKVEDYERALRKQEEKLNEAVRTQVSYQQEVNGKKADQQEIDSRLSVLPGYEESPLTLSERFTLFEQVGQDAHRQLNLEINLQGQQERYNDLRLRKEFAEKNLPGTARAKEPWWITLLAFALGLVGFFVFGPGPAGYFTLVGGAVLSGLMFLFFRRAAAQNAARDAARREQFQREIQALKKETERVGDSISILEGDLRIITRRIAETASGLGLANGFTREDLLLLRRELEKEEKVQSLREELEKQKEKASQAFLRALMSLEQAEKSAAEERQRGARLAGEWQEWCKNRGFPKLQPVDLISFLSLAEKTKDSLKKLEASRNEYEQVKKYVDSYVNRVNEVAGVFQYAPAARETAGDYVARYAEFLKEQQDKAAAVAQWEEELEKACTGKRTTGAELDEVIGSFQKLLNAGQAKDAEEFRALAQQFTRQERLKQDIAALEEQLLLIAGSPGEKEEMNRALAGSTAEENEEELKRVRAQLESTEEKISRLKDELAEIKLRLGQMESGEELAVARQEKVMLEERLLSKAREWCVRTLCAELLALAREKHERERQPGVLFQASLYFQAMTEGRYTRIVAPLGSPDQLEVEQPNGRRVGAALLSRGASNQLYLALRLALAGHYSSVAAPLPVILDDVLVDFDPRRLAGTVKILGEFAAGQQVLLFTCHRHILEVVEHTLPRYKCVHLERVN